MTDSTITTTEVTPDIASVITEAVRPWREKVRAAEGKVEAIRDALVDLFKEENFDSLSNRSDFNEFLSGLGLATIPRLITGEVEVVIRQTFTFEELELEDEDSDVEEAVTEWLYDEGHVDRYDWEIDSIEVSVDNE